jgi:hypothetical protein
MDMKHNIITQKSNNMLILTIEINFFCYINIYFNMASFIKKTRIIW